MDLPGKGWEPDKERIISFTDNVLSVAITLLVFDVRVPGDWKHLELHSAIITLGPRLLSFFLSFSVIGVYWVAHHIMYKSITRVSRQMLWLNNLFLMMLCLLPASAALLGAFPGQTAAVVLYGINLLAVSITLRMQWGHIVNFHAKCGAPIDPALIRSGRRRLGAGLFMAVIGVTLAKVDPWIGYVLYWAAPVSFAWLQFK